MSLVHRCPGSGMFVGTKVGRSPRLDANGYAECWHCKRLRKVNKSGYMRAHPKPKPEDS